MPYRTVLVHVDDSPRAAARIRLAAAIARRCQGQLVGAAVTGVSRFLYQAYPPEDKDPDLALHLAFLRERAQQALAGFAREAAASGLACYEARLIEDEAGAGISLHGRVADLVVIGQAEPDRPSAAVMADFPAYVVLNAGGPVLVVPYASQATAIGRQVLLSWDGSKEAARALRYALPLLAQAETVRIAVFDAAADKHTLGEASAADPLPFLARHGIQAELSVHALDARRGPHRRDGVGEALLSLATDLSADLLVMGAYGHSRLRETILGGVTRTVFDAMTIPVLMAH
jgi:nucleotide-binding universal stress UspA family protein